MGNIRCRSCGKVMRTMTQCDCANTEEYQNLWDIKKRKARSEYQRKKKINS